MSRVRQPREALPARPRGRCDQCGYDFGRFDSLSRHYEHMLDDLERKLGVDPTPR